MNQIFAEFNIRDLRDTMTILICNHIDRLQSHLKCDVYFVSHIHTSYLTTTRFGRIGPSSGI
jgi:hypothetical protein